MKENYKLIILAAVAAVVLFLFIRMFTAQAGATFNDNPWSECQQIACGSSEGIQSKEVSHYECPAGYNEIAGHCIKFVGYYPYILKADKVKITELETRACVVENPTACEEEPTPSPSPEPCLENCGNPPTFAGSSTEAPVCPEGETTNVVANPHVLRNGSQATVNFFITEGDSANIFYSVVGQPHWQHAVADVKANSDNFVSYTITGLDANLGYDFGIQQKRGCGGGKTTAVIVDGPEDQLFQITYWE